MRFNHFGKVWLGAICLLALYAMFRPNTISVGQQRALPGEELLPDSFNSHSAAKAACQNDCESKQTRFESAIKAERYLTHISTDKQTFLPGEPAYIRAILVSAQDGRPIGPVDYWGANLKIKGPTGSVVYEQWLEKPQDSIISAIWTIPSDTAGGEYQAEIAHSKDGCPTGTRTFFIRAFRTPTLSTTIDFQETSGDDSGGYGLGDVVRGRIKTVRSDGTPCAMARLFWTATLDGQALEVLAAPEALDERGTADFSFRLPAATAGAAQGSVGVTVADGGDVEGAAKTIPMVLRKLDMAIYPEGGDLVTGLPSAVYFEALTAAGEPVAVEGLLCEAGGAAAAAASPPPASCVPVAASHEGRGRFELTPAPGVQYEIRVVKPAGVAPVPVPAHSVGPGVVLRAGAGVVGRDEPVTVTVTALGSGRRLRVAVCRREAELSSAAVTSRHGEPLAVALAVPRAAAGVLRVTVYEGDVPLAERLVFRAPPRALSVAVSAAAADAAAPPAPAAASASSAARAPAAAVAPGSEVTVRVSVREEETGRPVAGAVVGLAVSDAGGLRLVERRRRAPLLPAMALLEEEVDRLDDPAAYLPEPPAAAGGGSEWEWVVPEDAAGLQASVRVMLSPIASFTSALEALIQEPCGCFEQTSSVTYPTVMALQYFRSRFDTPQEVITKSEEMLLKGWNRLIGYEVKESGGFEWFGASPAHEALTSYGLLLFLDMQKVWQPVGGMWDVLERTRQFLRRRRDDPSASFLLDPKHLDSFGGAPANVARAYILWSLSAQPGEADGLNAQIDALCTEAKSSEDPYLLGLAAGTMYNIGRDKDGQRFAKKVGMFQQSDGSVIKAVTSITSSRGDALVIETTSVAVLAWLQGGAQFEEKALKGIEYIASRCQDGRFGSTQATVLALKAIVGYEQMLGKQAPPGDLVLHIDGVEARRAVPDPAASATLLMDGLESFLTPGKHTLRLSQRGGGARLTYAASLRYHADRPAPCPACRVALTVTSPAPAPAPAPAAGGAGGAGGGGGGVMEGEVVEIFVEVAPSAAAAGGGGGGGGEEEDGGAVVLDGPALGMTVAVVGLPAGLEARFDQLREVVRAGAADAFELREGNEVVLYWRFLKERKTVRLEALAAVPGVYTGRASRAYEYYADDCKAWAPAPLVVTVRPR